MPGGFARVSDKSDARAVSIPAGVELAFLWVPAEESRRHDEPAAYPGKRGRVVGWLGNLPSRAADNLLWFGRYLEREEDRRAASACVRSIPTRRTPGRLGII